MQRNSPFGEILAIRRFADRSTTTAVVFSRVFGLLLDALSAEEQFSDEHDERASTYEVFLHVSFNYAFIKRKIQTQDDGVLANVMANANYSGVPIPTRVAAQTPQR